jgi:DNA-binding NtrC family response regulator
LYARLREVAEGSRPLIVQGEPGTGKKALGRIVHECSPRAEMPLVIVDCAGVPVERIDAELFGDPPDSAGLAGRHGALQRANQGTLLLDDVAHLPQRTQAQLAKVLRQDQDCAAAVRLIMTSERTIADELQRGRFDADLLAALDPITVTVPPLRSRPEDVLLLADHFMNLAKGQSEGGDQLRLSGQAQQALATHDWPGNARELRNVIERAVQRATVDRQLLIPMEAPAQAQAAGPSFDESLSYRETRARFEAEFERAYVGWLLERHRGNISAASREARMDRKYLYDLARRHGLRSGRGGA